MSELIDSIYNVEAIQKEIKTIEAYMDGLKNIISTYSADVKKLYDSVGFKIWRRSGEKCKSY